MSSKENILIFFQIDNNCISTYSLQLLKKAYEIKKELDCKIFGFIIDENPDKYKKELEGYALDTVYLYTIDSTFIEKKYAYIMQDAICKANATICLLAATQQGRTFASRVMVDVHAGLTADCTDLLLENNKLIQVRPTFGGNLMAHITTKDNCVSMATVRPDSFPIPEKNASSDYIQFFSIDLSKDSSLTYTDISLIKKSTPKKEKTIMDYQILFVAGGGFKNKEELSLIEAVAKKYNSVVASSRILVERGLTNYKKQIGISGSSVAPEILITFGVSGSVQFLSGIRGVKKIIAVNTDRNAPIMSHAHLAIVSDMHEVLHSMLSDKKMLKKEVIGE